MNQLLMVRKAYKQWINIAKVTGTRSKKSIKIVWKMKAWFKSNSEVDEEDFVTP